MKQVTIIIIISIAVLFMFTGIQMNIEAHKEKTAKDAINHIAAEYVKLAFQVGRYDKNYVDAYFGPPQLKKEALAEEKTLEDITQSIETLLKKCAVLPEASEGDMLRIRRKNLMRMLQSMKSRVDFLSGTGFTFDEESQALYGAVSPRLPQSHYDKLLAKLAKRLPGKGPLTDRVDAYKKQFTIPRDKLDKVFKTAIAEGRKRAKERIKLPQNESFILEYVTGKSWGAYNWFKGKGTSLIQVNVDLPITIDRAVDLACHEGYPGHHVLYSLIEQELYNKKNWLESSIYPLFSPLSLIAEGTANFGIEVAFPGTQRIEYEKKILFPLAGLDASKAEEYYDVLELISQLNFAGNDAARLFLDKKINAEQTVEMLMKYLLMTRKRAEMRLNFIKTYRAYVINYNLGLRMVKEYIDRLGGTADKPEKRWKLFKQLLSTPVLPADLL